jgi:hypothetical protein
MWLPLLHVASAFRRKRAAGIDLPAKAGSHTLKPEAYVRVAGSAFRRTVIMTSTPNRISVPKK